MSIQAIETQYKGYRFRSRLEARWAVFFTEFGMSWEYEVEGFILKNGIYYLPDFFFPESGRYVEIKPKGNPSGIEIEKARLLGEESMIFICCGDPWDVFMDPEYKIIVFPEEIGGVKISGLSAFFMLSLLSSDYLYVAGELINHINNGTAISERAKQIMNKSAEAIKKSRSARFEFGESGL